MIGSVVPEKTVPKDLPGSLVVETRDLWFGFNHSHAVLKGIDLKVAGSQVTVVLGAETSYLNVTVDKTICVLLDTSTPRTRN